MDNFNHDSNRTERLGFPEVVYGESKSIEILNNILEKFSSNGENVLVTKLQKKKANRLLENFPGAFYEPNSGIFILNPLTEIAGNKDVAILSAGSSDLHIVNEIYFSLGFLNIWSKRFTDIGIAGIHRLTDKIEEIKQYKILIVVAGFEGMLPSVVGGILPQPIIAVPTDVGYGVAKGGKAALNSMLASCANGITVLNINNGYGAAIAAFRILNIFK